MAKLRTMAVQSCSAARPSRSASVNSTVMSASVPIAYVLFPMGWYRSCNSGGTGPCSGPLRAIPSRFADWSAAREHQRQHLCPSLCDLGWQNTHHLQFSLSAVKRCKGQSIFWQAKRVNIVKEFIWCDQRRPVSPPLLPPTSAEHQFKEKLEKQEATIQQLQHKLAELRKERARADESLIILAFSSLKQVFPSKLEQEHKKRRRTRKEDQEQANNHEA